MLFSSRHAHRQLGGVDCDNTLTSPQCCIYQIACAHNLRKLRMNKQGVDIKHKPCEIANFEVWNGIAPHCKPAQRHCSSSWRGRDGTMVSSLPPRFTNELRLLISAKQSYKRLQKLNNKMQPQIRVWQMHCLFNEWKHLFTYQSCYSITCLYKNRPERRNCAPIIV